ncbi:DUF3168 domain-containing protein [uncultured Maritimibacter sp.]|jgi:hypothetical protein|uniref:tail completion protein gp17 n=1 Tax=uncultured Maritimibacter sp. TaxID=991866 RepID=UPI002602AAF2|nr:DUF3168 domain-containing protein [uncultured Maritimibacter sp.]
MADFEGAFRGLVLSAPAVSALIGEALFLVAVPEGETTGDRWAIWQTVGGSDDRTLDGRSGLFETRVQIDAYGKGTPMQAVAVDRAIYDFLADYRGAFGGVAFNYVEPYGKRDYRPETVGDVKIYRVSRDVLVKWAVA